MTSYNLAPNEILARCPYDPAHHVRLSRLTVHIQKCRERYNKSLRAKECVMDIYPCKFNPMHHVPAVELSHHYSICPDAGGRLRSLTPDDPKDHPGVTPDCWNDS